MSETEARPPEAAAVTPPRRRPRRRRSPFYAAWSPPRRADRRARARVERPAAPHAARLARDPRRLFPPGHSRRPRPSFRARDGTRACRGVLTLDLLARDGTILYANAAMTDLLGRGASGAPAALESARRQSGRGQALYRLQRAAEAGEVRREEIAAQVGPPGSATSRWLRIGVRPYRRGPRARDEESSPVADP